MVGCRICKLLRKSLKGKRKKQPVGYILLKNIRFEGIIGQAVNHFVIRLLLSELPGVEIEGTDSVINVKAERNIISFLDVIAGFDQSSSDRVVGAKLNKNFARPREFYTGGYSRVEDTGGGIEESKKRSYAKIYKLLVIIEKSVGDIAQYGVVIKTAFQ